MNLKQVAVSVSLLAVAATAMAVEATQYNPPAGELTRADVQAELRQAAASGELVARSETYGAFEWKKAPQTTVTRAEVIEEFARARAAGELPLAGEGYGSFDTFRTAPRAHASTGVSPHVSAKASAAKSGAL